MDPDQLASEKPADLDLRCSQNRIYQLRMVWVNTFINYISKVPGRVAQSET